MMKGVLKDEQDDAQMTDLSFFGFDFSFRTWTACLRSI